MNKIYMGIDPGKKGFITVDFPNGKSFYPIPCIGKELDLQTLSNTFEEIKSLADQEGLEIICGIENVHALYGSSASGTFSFGHVVGVLDGLLTAYKIPYVKVPPKEWQGKMFKGIPVMRKTNSKGKDCKAMSFLASKRMFPSIDLRRDPTNPRTRKEDDNKSDSLLICEYMKLKY